jgi:hypothetical protein
MQLVIDFYFLSICVYLYMFRASSAHHQESLTIHTDEARLEKSRSAIEEDYRISCSVTIHAMYV